MLINKISRYIVCGLLVTLLCLGQTPSNSTAVGGDPMYNDPYQNEPDYTQIPVGEDAAGVDVLFLAWTAGDNPTGTVALCVEVQPIGTDFTNVATACGTPVPYDSPMGFNVEVTIPDQLPGDYHWQGYTIDDLTNDSDWVPFGYNEESEIDYTILTQEEPPPDEDEPPVEAVVKTVTPTTTLVIPDNAKLPTTGRD